jgi:hypothetical protein
VTRRGVRLTAYDFVSQEHVPLRLYLTGSDGPGAPKSVALNVLDEEGWARWLAAMRPGFEERLRVDVRGAAEGEEATALPPADADGFEAMVTAHAFPLGRQVWFAPRGIGPSAWDPDEKKQTQIRRRFALLGQTVDGMRVWDVRRAIQALREVVRDPHPVQGTQPAPFMLYAERRMAGVALYASLFEPNITDLDLTYLPTSHRSGPDLLNVLKTLDMPAAVALAAERSSVWIRQDLGSGWEYPTAVASKLGWGEDRVQVRAVDRGSHPYRGLVMPAEGRK